MECNFKSCPRAKASRRPGLPALFGYAALALALLFVFAALAGPALATEEWIEKLLEEKKELEGQLSGLKGKAAELEKAREEYIDAYHYLKRQEIRLQGFQLWNAFVGFISVAHDSMQKVNPGNSVVVATATFVQDRVGGAMDNPPLKARVRTVSETVRSIGPALTQLDYAIKMDKQQVADLLHNRGMVESTWLTRWQRNPEDTALSKSVITGKITFIQERLGPAATAIYKAKLELDETIPLLAGHVKALEERIKQIDINVEQIRRHMDLHNALELARKIENPPTVEIVLYPGEAKAYGAAFSTVQGAWNDLKGNQINGETYRQLKQKAYIDASTYRSEQMRPYSERWTAASRYFWDELLPRLRTIEDAATRRSLYDAASARLNAAADAYWAASKKESDAYKAQFDDPMKGLMEEEKAERERWQAFAQRIDNLLETRVDTWIINPWEKTIEVKTVPLRNIGLNGSSLANAAWSYYWNHSFLYNQTSSNPPVWSLKDASKQIEEWEKQIREIADFAKEIYSTAQSADTTFSGFASEIDGLANELEPNRMVWSYFSWAGTASGQYYSPSNLYAQMNMAMTIYNAGAKSGEETIKSWTGSVAENARKATQIKSAMQGSDALLKDGEAIYELKKEAYYAYINPNLDRSGNNGRGFLYYSKITSEAADAAEDFVRSLVKEEEIENHLFAVMRYDWEEYSRVPRSIEELAGIKERFTAGDTAAANAYNRYDSAYRAYNSAEKRMEATLSNMRSKLMDLAPGLLRFLYLDAILNVVANPYSLSWNERSAYNWFPVDAQDLAAGWPAAGPVFTRLENIRRQYEQKIEPVKKEMAAGFPKRAAKIDALTRQAEALAKTNSISSEAAFRRSVDSLRDEGREIYDDLAKRVYLSSTMAFVRSYYRFNSALSWAYSRMQYLIARDSHLAGVAKLLEEAAQLAGQAHSEEGIEKARHMAASLENIIGPGSTLAYYASANEANAGGLISRGHDMIVKLNEYIAQARQSLAAAVTAQVQEFYRTFARTYEQRNASAVVRLMDDRWTAADGTDLVDVEEMLDNSFSVFDRVEYRIENLTVSARQDGKAVASYNVTIVGRILRQDLVHQEKSTVNDVLANDGKGWRIIQTLGGQFWK
ncbi:MAG: hypothetical protein QMD09_09755 [Desulfatibacillaceae bacterium]|nr:hypothetical protein [Desulfatibacillaceae bacterium]